MLTLDKTGRIMPDQVSLLVDYDPDTGIMRWEHRTSDMFVKPVSSRIQNMWNTKFAYTEIKSLNSKGYLTTCICGKGYKVSRLAYAYMTGKWPDEIDHANHVKNDNRWINLSNVSHKENSHNFSISKLNTSGRTGVTWHHHNQKWIAQIGSGKSRTYLGTFVDYDDAVVARKAAEIKYNYHENHGEN